MPRRKRRRKKEPTGFLTNAILDIQDRGSYWFHERNSALHDTELHRAGKRIKGRPRDQQGGHLFQVQHRICRGYPIPMLMKKSDGDRANGFGGNPSLSSRVGAAMPKATRSGDVQINRVYSFSIRSWVQRVGRIASTLSYQLISLAH